MAACIWREEMVQGEPKITLLSVKVDISRKTQGDRIFLLSLFRVLFLKDQNILHVLELLCNLSIYRDIWA